MLPVINLDDENFNEIFEEARQMISGVFPVWTDYNEHDPGITFLELFSWFKEMQQFHMNQIGNKNELMYLKLLGMQQKKRTPARALVTFQGNKQDFELPKGSRLLADEISFETIEKENIEGNRILRCISRSKAGEVKAEGEILNSGSNMMFYVFGENPESGNEFLIQLDKPMEEAKIHSLFFKMNNEYRVKRNAISREDDFYPLAKLSVSCYCKGGWRNCEVIRDETYQLIQSGKLYFRTDMPFEELEGGYYIKILLEENNYEIAPLLQEISLNVIEAVQQDTLSQFMDYVIEKNNESQDYQLMLDSCLSLGTEIEIYIRSDQGFYRYENYRIDTEKDRLLVHFGNLFENRTVNRIFLRIVSFHNDFSYRRCYKAYGFPYLNIDLEDTDIFYDSFEIFVENELLPGYYRQWKKVDSFSGSKEADCHYVLDEVKGILHFGDCENGKAPEGNILIIGYADTLGIRGNVKSGQISRFVDNQENITVINQDNASGGCNKETIDACFKRFIREFRQVKRAITDEDYEYLVKTTPGLMIENVKAIGLLSMKKRDGSVEENSVTIVIQPYSIGKKASLNKAYYNNIKQLLDKKRLIGTEVNILSPEYIGISIIVEAVVKPQYINAYDFVENAVEEYFQNTGSEFGKSVLYNEIYGIIDVLDCVSQVLSLTVNFQGKGAARNRNGDIILPANGFAYLKEAQYMISSEE